MNMKEWNEHTERKRKMDALIQQAFIDQYKKELEAENKLLRFCLKNCTCLETEET